MAKKPTKISELSKETGISRTTLTTLYYERSAGIQYRTLLNLCLAFNCQPGDLFKVKSEEENE
ncbi:helix-turn-helix domain-containing protein [Sporolactobacillus terrae]|nr:helix-turn-helix transcriptional regulator [Sporolactobacillus terrae]